MFHDLLPIPLWSIIALMIVIIIHAYVLIAGRNAGAWREPRRPLTPPPPLPSHSPAPPPPAA